MNDMYQMMKFKEPIPSCEIYALEWDGTWLYVYAVKTPVELVNDEDIMREHNLVVYEHISDLSIRSGNDLHEESINIKIRSLDHYLNMLSSLRDTDISYRKKWLKEHPDASIGEHSKKRLMNRTYNYDELKDLGIHYVSSVISTDDDGTTFAAI